MTRPVSTASLAVSLPAVLVLTVLGGAPAQAQQGGARGVVIEAETFAPGGVQSAPSSGEAAPAAVRGEGGDEGGEESAAARRGPGVELITGGRSTDGAAHVGRLPVLE